MYLCTLEHLHTPVYTVPYTCVHLCRPALQVSVTRERDSSVSELQGSLASLRQELGAVQSSLAASSQELQQYRSDNSELSASLGQRLARELAEERERGAAAVQEVQQRAEQERREGEARQARTVQHLENRVASLDVQNRDLVEVRYRHEAGIREARAKVRLRSLN